MRRGLSLILTTAAVALFTTACPTVGPINGGGSGNPASDICAGKGPIVTIPGATTTGTISTCTGQIAETRFVNALCTCNDAHINGYLHTRAFDSAQGTTPDLGGSVGINQTYLNAAGYTDVGGSLSIAGNQSLNLAGYVKTGADLRVQGSATVAGYANVGRNMWVGSGYTDLGPLSIAGDLHASGTVLAIPLFLKGKRYQESVTVPPPCPCGDKDILDVAALVADAKVNNDDAVAGIVPTTFNELIGYATATLPCGKFYIEKIGGIGDVIITVTGRAALFVDGSVANAGNLEFKLGPGAEIDLFIRDNLSITGRALFGDRSHPAASRVYIGGSGDVRLTGTGDFVGNLYAPRSLVSTTGYGVFLGSVFARDFVCDGFADFTYDLAIGQAGNCPKPPTPPPTPPTPPTCTQCNTCTGGTACVGGTCGPCRTDADCCSQMICSNGQCIQPGTIY